MGIVSVFSAEVDDDVRKDAIAVLAERGLTVSDAIRILLTRLATERDFARDLVPTSAENQAASGKTWGDFFDRPGIDIEEPDDPPFEVRESF